MKLSIIIPCFNEINTIEKIIQASMDGPSASHLIRWREQTRQFAIISPFLPGYGASVLLTESLSCNHLPMIAHRVQILHNVRC